MCVCVEWGGVGRSGGTQHSFLRITFLTEEVTLSLQSVRSKGYPFHIPTVESLETLHLFFIGTLFVRDQLKALFT